MKIKIATTIALPQSWLDEVKTFIPDVVFEIVTTNAVMAVYFNTTQQSMYGDFTSVRAIVNSSTADARVLIMSYTQLRNLGITNHLALYDNADRDGVLDCYIGLNDALDSRAKANGFSSNFALCREIIHGIFPKQNCY